MFDHGTSTFTTMVSRYSNRMPLINIKANHVDLMIIRVDYA